MANSIIARLGLDSRDFREGVAQAKAALGGFATGAIGAVISTTAIKNIVEFGDRIQDLHDRFNVSTDALQRMGGVAEKEGSSLEGVAKGYNKLAINSDLALKGNNAMVESFADLGVTVDELKTLSPEEIMLKIGKGSLNASSLVRVLGKSALELAPTLRKLANGTAEFSAAIDSVDIKKLSDANDKLREIEAEIRVFGAGILGRIADGYHLLANDTRNMGEDYKKTWQAAFDAVAAAAKGNFAGMLHAGMNFTEAQKQMVKDMFIYRENGAAPTGARVEGGASGPQPLTAAADKAAQKERERTQLSLKDLSELNPAGDVELRNNIQARYASDQARKVQELEAQAHRQSELQDFGGARTTLDRADALRQGISGLKESEKRIGTWVIDESTTAQLLQTVADRLVGE